MIPKNPFDYIEFHVTNDLHLCCSLMYENIFYTAKIPIKMIRELLDLRLFGIDVKYEFAEQFWYLLKSKNDILLESILGRYSKEDNARNAFRYFTWQISIALNYNKHKYLEIYGT